MPSNLLRAVCALALCASAGLQLHCQQAPGEQETPSLRVTSTLVFLDLTVVDKSGKPVDMTFRVTDVWQRQKGQWKIIHTHISFPIDMTTGKADMQSNM